MSSRAHRYLSPVFVYEKPTARMVKIVSAGLTNRPNLKLEALNTEGGEEESRMDQAITDALGLNADASVTSIVAAINGLKDARAEALNRIADFETAEKGRLDEAINRALDEATEAGKIKPGSRGLRGARPGP